MSKSVEEALLERRSRRRYTRDRISDEDMDFIYKAIRNTPTSYNGEQFTVIDIDDQELKEKIYGLTNQKQIKTCNHFLVFCADFRKITVAAEAKGVDVSRFPATVDGYTVGVIDASLALMSALVAAESRGLATCPIGYIRTVAPDVVSELLGLPQGVALVCGLAIGVPNEQPDMKPKEPESLLIHHNRYSQDDMAADLLEFDRVVSEYNRTRTGTKSDNDWVSHIVGYYHEGVAKNILEAMRRQGYLTEDK
ncbi:MAG: nitroreductase family protein [Muribaculaceae bacterium]|nr:nitroreductase family protein [Muribaculaceae bacterium]